MNRHTVQRLSIVTCGALVIIALFVSWVTVRDSFAGPADSEVNPRMSESGSGTARQQSPASGLDNTPKGGTLSGGTVPGGTWPNRTLPGGTVPSDTWPERTLPGGTVPGGTWPSSTPSGGTVPGGTVPSEKLPGEGP